MKAVLAAVRDIVPIRPLTIVEATHIAERQATLLLELLGVTEPPVPEEAIASIPRIQIERIFPSPVAGAVQWSHGRWLIVVNGSDPIGRQRFSIAHELKHVLDARFDKVLYPPFGGFSSHQRAEGVCDYFAGCLLMPRPWLKRAWHQHTTDPNQLAHIFDVSRQAMQVRMLQIGLTRPTPRHLVESKEGRWRNGRI